MAESSNWMIAEKRTAIVHKFRSHWWLHTKPFRWWGLNPDLHLLFAVRSAGHTEVEVTNLNPWVPHRTLWPLEMCQVQTEMCCKCMICAGFWRCSENKRLSNSTVIIMWGFLGRQDCSCISSFGNDYLLGWKRRWGRVSWDPLRRWAE